MLRIGKLTDYAMLILSHMARHTGLTLSAATLANALYLKVPTVSKVLKMLSEADLVSSVRGAEGGYHLARSAEKITVADILMAMEGGLSLTECCEGAGLCVIDSLCSMRENWKKINKLFQSYLKEVTLIDMLSPLTLQLSPRGLSASPANEKQEPLNLLG